MRRGLRPMSVTAAEGMRPMSVTAAEGMRPMSETAAEGMRPMSVTAAEGMRPMSVTAAEGMRPMSVTAASVVRSILRKSIEVHWVSGCPSEIHRGFLVCPYTIRLLFRQACAIMCARVRAVYAHPIGLNGAL